MKPPSSKREREGTHGPSCTRWLCRRVRGRGPDEGRTATNSSFTSFAPEKFALAMFIHKRFFSFFEEFDSRGILFAKKLTGTLYSSEIHRCRSKLLVVEVFDLCKSEFLSFFRNLSLYKSKLSVLEKLINLRNSRKIVLEGFARSSRINSPRATWTHSRQREETAERDICGLLPRPLIT